MRTTIDSGGRVVIPKSIRDEAGLDAGVEVEVAFRDGRVEIAPAPVAMRVTERADGLAIESDREMPALTTDDVRSTLERVRR
jgi:AbrB family looped-hinge helix DNA binding protein